MSDLISRQDAISELYNINPSEDMLFVDAIVGMLENLPEKSGQKWIPVTEALPENRNVVLVIAYWHETYQVMMASYYGNSLWWCVPYNNCGKHMQKLNPIAWMPLPEPWRGE